MEVQPEHIDLIKFGVVGLFATFAITLVKTFLPYLKPAKQTGLSEELNKTFGPLHQRQIDLLDKINERDITTHTKVCSNHDNLKLITLQSQDTLNTCHAFHKRLDKLKCTAEGS